MSVARWVAETAARSPDRLAVVSEAGNLTYRELMERSHVVASELVNHGFGPEDVAGVFLSRSPDFLVAVLGILLAGGAYLPLDPEYPVDRLKLLLGHSKPKVVVTRASASLPVLAADIRRVDVDSIATPPRHIQSVADDQRLAYVMFTSGSTGTPKAVMVENASLAHYVRTAIDELAITADDRILQFASLSWDTSIEEIFPCLVRGATLYLRTTEMMTFGGLTARCAKWGISVMNLPTAFWNAWTASLTDGNQVPNSLRLLVIGGERADPATVARWQACVGDRVQLVNTYGLTEATAVTVSCDLGKAGDAGSWRQVPIGRPWPGMQVHVLDEDRRVVDSGVVGELYVGGHGIARGYLNQPGMTAERFGPNPFGAGRLYRTGDLVRVEADDQIVVVGRADQQLKIRGHRVECGEVEAIIAGHPSVRAVVVTGRPAGPANTMALIAYVVTDASVDELRGYIEARAPAYMVPSIYVALPALPQLPNGKVDRGALPAPSVDTSQGGEPETVSERTLARIWEGILNRKVRLSDRFFDVGGHSLSAVQILSRIGMELQIELPLSFALDNPSLAEMTAELERRTSQPVITIVPLKQVEGPTVQVQRYFFRLNELDPTASFARSHDAYRISGPFDCDVMSRAMDLVVQRHEILRTNFERRGSDIWQIVRPAEPRFLAIDDQSARTRGRDLDPTMVKQSMTAFIDRTFDVEHSEVVRAKVVRLGAHDHVLITAMHHVAFDEHSWCLYADELGSAYRMLVQKASVADVSRALGEPPFQFLDVATRLEAHADSEAGHAALEFWRRKLDGAEPVRLPTDHPRDDVDAERAEAQRRGPANSHIDQYSAFFLAGVATASADAAFVETAMKLIARERATPLAFLLTGLTALLHDETEQTDITFNTNVGTRPFLRADKLLGPFHSPTFVRVDLSSRPTYRELLADLRQSVVDMVRYGTVPVLERVWHHVGRLGFSFVGMNGPLPNLRLGGARTTLLPLAPSRMDTHFDFWPVLDMTSQGLSVHLVHNQRLFRQATAERLAAKYVELLRRIVATPDARVGT